MHIYVDVCRSLMEMSIKQLIRQAPFSRWLAARRRYSLFITSGGSLIGFWVMNRTSPRGTFDVVRPTTSYELLFEPESYYQQLENSGHTYTSTAHRQNKTKATRARRTRIGFSKCSAQLCFYFYFLFHNQPWIAPHRDIALYLYAVVTQPSAKNVFNGFETGLSNLCAKTK